MNWMRNNYNGLNLVLKQTSGSVMRVTFTDPGPNTGLVSRIFINIAAGTFLCTRSSIANATTNGSGVLIATGAVMGNASNSFAIATGTGYCVRGTGIHAYAYIVTANSALLAYNVRIQNTLAANVPYTTAFTSAP